MTFFEVKLSTKALEMAKILPIMVAILGQLALPMVAKAGLYPEVANSTTKIAAFETKTTEKPETSIKLAMADQPEEPKPDRVMRAVITAYTSTPGQTDDTPFIAASGKRVFDGMIAANGFPFGTLIKIPALYGDKIFVVEDRMNSRYGQGRFDIWLDTSRAEAMKFGVKRVEVEIYYKKKVPKEVAVNTVR